MKIFILLIIPVLLFVSCGGYKTGVLEKENSGFIKFTGNTANAVVEIEDLIEFTINPETELYKLKPGKYTVRVFRGDNLLVERIIIIQAPNIIELEIP